MQDIIDQHDKITFYKDHFRYWHEELGLRQSGRQKSFCADEIALKDEKDINFLFRSLYFQRNLFFQILFNNMDKMPVINWLINAHPTIFKGFLDFLPWQLNNNTFPPQALQFLLNIYKQEYYDEFVAIVNILDLDTCNYLANKTANTQLRELIRKKADYLSAREKAIYYGIMEQLDNALPFPTIYGDKKDILANAANLFKESLIRNLNNPYGLGRFSSLLQASELLFQSGLVEDALAVLIGLYEDYQQKSRLVEIIEDELIYKQFHKLLRRVIPLHALLVNPLQAHSLTLEIYDEYFPRFSPEPASLIYLDIYESITSGFTASNKNVIYEISYKSQKVQLYRPAETPLLKEKEIAAGFEPARIKALYSAINQKMNSLTHEAFITMELMRLLQLYGLIRFHGTIAKALIDKYLDLWRWIPTRRFVNHSLVQELGKFTDDSNRYELAKILDMLDYYNDEKLLNDLNFRPDLFKNKNENLRREIFTGKFMGVL